MNDIIEILYITCIIISLLIIFLLLNNNKISGFGNFYPEYGVPFSSLAKYNVIMTATNQRGVN